MLSGCVASCVQSAFWVFNLVSNWAYTRYDLIHPEVQQRIQQVRPPPPSPA